MDLDFKQPFLELNRILEALHEQDLGPALEYVGLWVVPQGTGLVCSSRHPAYLTVLSHGPHRRFWRPCQAPFSCLTSSHSAGLFLPRWAVSHRQRLLELNSSLEFKLHRLQFIRLLAGGPEKQLEALSYARHFQPFAHVHQRGTCPGAGVAPATCIPLCCSAAPAIPHAPPPLPPQKKIS